MFCFFKLAQTLLETSGVEGEQSPQKMAAYIVSQETLKVVKAGIEVSRDTEVPLRKCISADRRHHRSAAKFISRPQIQVSVRSLLAWHRG